MNQLRELDVIVHTGYSVIGLEGVPLHPRQEELRELWLARLQSRSGRSDYLALYFPSHYNPGLHRGLDENEYPFEVAEEVERISQYRSVLGDKLIVLKGGILPLERRGWEKLIQNHNLYYNPKKLRINAFGEMYDYCVEAWGYSLACALGIERRRVSKIRDISVDSIECTKFQGWQYEQLNNAA